MWCRRCTERTEDVCPAATCPRASRPSSPARLAGHFAAEDVKAKLNELNQKWESLKSKASQRRQDLEDSLQAQQYFADANEAESWMREKEPIVGSTDYGKDEDSAEVTRAGGCRARAGGWLGERPRGRCSLTVVALQSVSASSFPFYYGNSVIFKEESRRPFTISCDHFSILVSFFLPHLCTHTYINTVLC